MRFDLLTATVIVANLLGAAMAIPQAAKIVRSRHIAGVSPGWAGMSATVNAWWAVYGVAVGELGIVPVCVVSVMAYGVIARAIVRHRPGRRRQVLGPMAGGAAVLAIVPAITLVAGGWTATGIALGALYGVQLSPAVVAVYRTVDVTGVSAATWALALGEAALWGVYGSFRLDVGLLALAATGSLMSAAVLARLFVRLPRRGAGAPTSLDLAVGAA